MQACNLTLISTFGFIVFRQGHVVFRTGLPGINFLQLIPFSVLFKFMLIAVHLKLKASLT